MLLGCAYVVMAALVAGLPSRSAKIDGASSAVAAGAEVWRSANCTACHSIYGLGGHIGPDLTNAITRLGDEGVARKIAAGGRAMPTFPLTEEQSASLVAWLSDIDATGVYPLPQLFSPGFGDIR